MKKIGLLIIGMLIIVAFCGKKGDDSLEKRGEQKKQTFLEKTKENYSEHIKIYDRILNIDKGLLYYFEDAGMEREFRKIDADDIEVNIGVDQALIDKLKSIKDSKEKKSELDKKAIAMLPALETMLPIVNEMKTYYVQKGYKVDNFVKAQEYHTRLLAVTEKFKQVERPYKELFDKKSKEIKKEIAKEFDKKKEHITYNRFLFLENGEAFLDEIHKQGLDASDFTRGNVNKFKPLRDKIKKSLEKLERSSKNEKQAKKEGYNSTDDFIIFNQKANRFRDIVNKFIIRIEKKDKASHSSVSDSFFAQTEEGTPENVLSEFNEVVEEHNKLLNMKKNK